MNKHAIYIFTCNRPTKLESLLLEMSLFQKGKYDIYIIDDTSKMETIEENKKIINRYDNLLYLGLRQYLDFYQFSAGLQNCHILGDVTWNLGIARNFALDHSISLDYEKVLFLDDDITEINESKVIEGFSVLHKDCFVSCTLEGLEDNSIIGHIAKKVGAVDDDDKMLSGGYLFLSPASISSRFFNIYNEDWILQILENQKERIILPYSVCHNVNQDVKWTLDTVIFQELGELVVEGLLENKYALSMDYLFWDVIIENRIRFIKEIKEEAIKTQYEIGQIICDGLLNWLNLLDGQSLFQSIVKIKNQHHEHKI